MQNCFSSKIKWNVNVVSSIMSAVPHLLNKFYPGHKREKYSMEQNYVIKQKSFEQGEDAGTVYSSWVEKRNVWVGEYFRAGNLPCFQDGLHRDIWKYHGIWMCAPYTLLKSKQSRRSNCKVPQPLEENASSYEFKNTVRGTVISYNGM